MAELGIKTNSQVLNNPPDDVYVATETSKSEIPVGTVLGAEPYLITEGSRTHAVIVSRWKSNVRDCWQDRIGPVPGEIVYLGHLDSAKIQ